MKESWRVDKYNKPPISDLDGKVPVIVQQARPTISNPSDWAVMLVSREYKYNEEDLQEEIARIDNWHHRTHIHRFFEGEDVKEFLPHDFTLDDAREYLDDNHENFMKRYYSD